MTALPEPTTAPETPAMSPALVRRIDRTQPAVEPPKRLTRSGFAAVSVLGVLLLGIIGVAFRGSWTAHRDAALAAHFDQTGAFLYPFAPDGLIVIALIAAMVLRHDPKARFYSLSIVGGFTFSSYVVNHLHGLGMFAADPRSGQLPHLHWAIVGLIAGQLIGAMFFGSHLLVYVLRHLFPGTTDDQQEHPAGSASGAGADQGSGAGPETVREVHLPPDPEDVAKTVYGLMLDLGQSVGRDKLAKVCGIGPRAAVRIRKAVEQEREEAELEDEEPAEAKATDLPPLVPIALPPEHPPYALNGSGPVNGSGPGSDQN